MFNYSNILISAAVYLDDFFFFLLNKSRCCQVEGLQRLKGTNGGGE